MAKFDYAKKINEVVQPVERINAITGDTRFLYYHLKLSIQTAKRIDIIVAFLMESGVAILVKDLKEAVQRGVKVRILTGNYLNVTQPSALYLLKQQLPNNVELRFYKNPQKSFHPKSYIFHNEESSEIYIGSSNISRSALTSAIEWNYRFKKSENERDFAAFAENFDYLFESQSYEITDKVLKDYSKKWKKPYVQKDLERYDEEEREQKIQELIQPTGAQIEALYSLEQTREEGFDKGIVVAATGVGKTFLAAFDSKSYQRVLFVAHKEEILKQAADSFYQVRKSNEYGFFNGSQKVCDKQVVFAMVQTLGKEEYLNDTYFSKDAFDYIVIDEFHHAVAGNYQNIMNYFEPKFLLGLTATPERLDTKNVFELCDFNCVYEVRLKEAINKGWLVPFRYYGVYDDTVNYDNVRYIAGQYSEKELEQALMLQERSELIYKHYRKYTSTRAIGFCSSKRHAKYMAEAFCTKGIKAAAVYSKSGEEVLDEFYMERGKAIASLKTGELNVLFAVDMFNEGLDVKAIDLIMFLRPTESPTIFLQQLGRGLRKSRGKEYVTVLDFIGNYKKAELIPYLLSGGNTQVREGRSVIPKQNEFPEDCIVDFDFRVVDLFWQMEQKTKKLQDRIRMEYTIVKEQLGHVPSRMELFTYMDDEVYRQAIHNVKFNPFKNYMQYIDFMGDLNEKEAKFYNTIGSEFIHMIETTAMSKSYKMPLLLAYYNKGNMKAKLTEQDVYESFYSFYHKGSNKVDMLKDKSTKGFESWSKKEYIKLAKDNPIKFMSNTHSKFFYAETDGIMELCDDVKQWIVDKEFTKQVIDAIEYRVMEYYKNRFDRRQEE